MYPLNPRSMVSFVLGRVAEWWCGLRALVRRRPDWFVVAGCILLITAVSAYSPALLAISLFLAAGVASLLGALVAARRATEEIRAANEKLLDIHRQDTASGEAACGALQASLELEREQRAEREKELCTLLDAAVKSAEAAEERYEERARDWTELKATMDTSEQRWASELGELRQWAQEREQVNQERLGALDAARQSVEQLREKTAAELDAARAHAQEVQGRLTEELEAARAAHQQARDDAATELAEALALVDSERGEHEQKCVDLESAARSAESSATELAARCVELERAIEEQREAASASEQHLRDQLSDATANVERLEHESREREAELQAARECTEGESSSLRSRIGDLEGAVETASEELHTEQERTRRAEEQAAQRETALQTAEREKAELVARAGELEGELRGLRDALQSGDTSRGDHAMLQGEVLEKLQAQNASVETALAGAVEEIVTRTMAAIDTVQTRSANEAHEAPGDLDAVRESVREAVRDEIGGLQREAPVQSAETPDTGNALATCEAELAQCKDQLEAAHVELRAQRQLNERLREAGSTPPASLGGDSAASLGPVVAALARQISLQVERLEAAAATSAVTTTEHALRTGEIQSAASIVGRFVNCLLDISGVTRGGPASEARVVEVREMVEEVIDLVRTGISGQPPAVKCDYREDTPAHVRADGQRLFNATYFALCYAADSTSGGAWNIDIDSTPRTSDDGIDLGFSVRWPARATKVREGLLADRSGPDAVSGADPVMPASLRLVEALIELMGGSVERLAADDGSAGVRFTAPVVGMVLDGSERRIHARLNLDDVECNLGTILDMSLGGARLRCTRPPTDRVVDFEITDGEETVRTSAEVVWKKRMGFRRFEIGLRFLGLRSEIAERLTSLAMVNRHRRVVDEEAA